jgi:hypothetical protein
MSKFTLMADEPPASKKPNNLVFGLVVLGLVIGAYALMIFDPQLLIQIHDFAWRQ